MKWNERDCAVIKNVMQLVGRIHFQLKCGVELFCIREKIVLGLENGNVAVHKRR